MQLGPRVTCHFLAAAWALQWFQGAFLPVRDALFLLYSLQWKLHAGQFWWDWLRQTTAVIPVLRSCGHLGLAVNRRFGWWWLQPPAKFSWVSGQVRPPGMFGGLCLSSISIFQSTAAAAAPITQAAVDCWVGSG